MENKVVFAPSKIYRYPNKDHMLVVEGRAYADIYEEDIFSAQVVKDGKSAESLSLKLLSIVTYGKHIDFLCSGMTGTIYIRGEYDLRDVELEQFKLLVPCFQARHRICTEILETDVENLPVEIKSKIALIQDVDFFSEYIQFSYKYKTLKEFEELIKKYCVIGF